MLKEVGTAYLFYQAMLWDSIMLSAFLAVSNDSDESEIQTAVIAMAYFAEFIFGL